MKKVEPITRSASKSKPGRGGKRKGAGRKPSGNVRAEYWVKPATKQKIASESKKQKLNHPGELLDILLS